VVFVEDRLIPRLQVDDRQALHPKPDISIKKYPSRVGAAMLDHIAHPIDRTRSTFSPKEIFAGNAAHGFSLAPGQRPGVAIFPFDHGHDLRRGVGTRSAACFAPPTCDTTGWPYIVSNEASRRRYRCLRTAGVHEAEVSALDVAFYVPRMGPLLARRRDLPLAVLKPRSSCSPVRLRSEDSRYASSSSPFRASRFPRLSATWQCR